jgi:TRAP-type mannitol/chloroaromatic compound transport system substrate-binding protein
MGASVTTLAGSEVYPSLERKVIDAAEYSLPNIDYDLGFHEIAKYMHVPGVHQPSSILELIVSKKSWEALPKDLQELVKAVAAETTLMSLMHGIKLDTEAVEKFKQHGTEFVSIPPETQKEIKKRAEALYDKKAASDPFFKKVIESQRAWLAKYEPYDELMTPGY